MDVVIYHNPDCGTSRSTLKLIRALGIEPRVVEYLKTPPDDGELLALVHEMGFSLRQVLREKGTPFSVLGLKDPAKTTDELLDAIRQNPILINRPIVRTNKGVRLCRPSDIVLDIVLDLLPEPPRQDVVREDGTSFLWGRKLTSPKDLAIAMKAAGLPTQDLGDPGRTFLCYTRLNGDVVGYGGFELYGQDVLLRSMAVTASFHGKGNGRNLAALLMRRAYDHGARQAYALTDRAESRIFFERIGFSAIDRSTAPATILGTRQASGLCPTSATLLTKRINL